MTLILKIMKVISSHANQIHYCKSYNTNSMGQIIKQIFTPVIKYGDSYHN